LDWTINCYDDRDDDGHYGVICMQEQSVYKAEAKVSSVSDGKLLCTLQVVAPCAVACNNMCIVIGQFSFQFSFSFLLASIELVNNVLIPKLMTSRTPFLHCWLLNLNFIIIIRGSREVQVVRIQTGGAQSTRTC